MDNFVAASADAYRYLHPDKDHVPPLVTNDGDVAAIGTAHGRTIPVIGATRPPVYDVSLHPYDGSATRIYGDDADDIVAVMCGKDYQHHLTRCRQLLTQFNSDTGDELDDAAQEDIAHDFYRARAHLELIRGAFAHIGRAIAQGHINQAAKESGQWSELSDQEQAILTKAADRASEKAPIGVLRTMPFADINNPDELTYQRRGTWTAAVPLVVNQSDYYPWSNVPGIYSEVAIEVPDGTVYLDNTSDFNLRTIRVETAEAFLHDLHELGVITMKVRTAWPVDPLYREFYEDSLTKKLAEPADTQEEG